MSIQQNVPHAAYFIVPSELYPFFFGLARISQKAGNGGLLDSWHIDLRLFRLMVGGGGG